MMRLLATAVANRLQHLYEKHRIPETWGSPRVSRYVFDTLRQEGFWAAHKDVRRRLRWVGYPGLSVGQKLTALLAGVTMVALADTLLREKRLPVTRYGKQTFAASTPRSLVMLYTVGAALLVAANGGGESGLPPSFSDEDSVEYYPYSRPDETDGQHGFYGTDAWDEWTRRDDSSPGEN